MELDFSILDGIEPSGASQDKNKENPERKFAFVNTAPADQFQSMPRNQAKTSQGTEQTQRQIKNVLEQLKEEKGKLVAEHVAAQKKSRKLQGEILQGMAKGENLASLLLKAMQCIELVTGESDFSARGADYLRAVYGKALKEPEALAVTIDQIKRRLQLLQDAENKEQDEREKKLIRAALEVAKKEIAELQKN